MTTKTAGRQGKGIPSRTKCEGGTTMAMDADSHSASHGEEVRKVGSRNRNLADSSNSLEWEMPQDGDGEQALCKANGWHYCRTLEIKAWAIWEYSRELFSRQPFSKLLKREKVSAAKKRQFAADCDALDAETDPHKRDALCANLNRFRSKSGERKDKDVFDICYAVFGTSAPLVCLRRFDTPWKALLPIERVRMAGMLHASNAFAATFAQRETIEENGAFVEVYAASVDLPRGTDVIRGLFAIDRAKGRKRILKEFEQWLDKKAGVTPLATRGRGHGAAGPAEKRIKELAALRYLAARGVSIDKRRDKNGNVTIEGPSGRSQDFDHMRRSAVAAEKTIAECAAIAARVLARME